MSLQTDFRVGVPSLWRTVLAVAILCLGMSAHAQTINTYTNTTVGTINDVDCALTPVTRTFTVPTSYIVSDIDLGVQLSHTYRSDLRISLKSPAGTTVNVMGNTGGSTSNLNDKFNDQAAASITTHPATQLDGTTPLYADVYQPGSSSNPNNYSSTLAAFNGENAQGNWTLVVCDSVAVDTGTFTRADLYIKQAPALFVDLSLAKGIVSSAAPGATMAYALSVTNASVATTAATGVVVKDILPTGVTFVSSSGDGTYNSGTGAWTVGNIPIGGTKTLTINVTVTAAAGTNIVNMAEVSAQDQADLDSTPNNGVTSEDDYATVSFLSGTRLAGIPPPLTCSAGTTQLDWDSAGATWTAGSSSGTPAVPALGTVSIAITNPAAWQNVAAFGGPSPAKSNGLTGGLIPAQMALTEAPNFTSNTQAAVTTITLPAGVQGAQFKIFDIDNGGQFSDMITVTGNLGAATVYPVLTNGVTNYVTGTNNNIAIGDVAANNSAANGNVTVTFSSAIDKITISFGNHTTAPANPGNQEMSIHDINFCYPLPTITMLKSSIIYNNGVDAALATPGNDALYSVVVSNTGFGPATSNSLFIVDPLPAEMTFFNGDANGPGTAGTDPVIFSDSSSGLSAFNYATDVRYATGSTAPASFAACTYVPAAGYDPNVKYVCINPKGVLSGKTGPTTPSFTVQFRTRIN